MHQASHVAASPGKLSRCIAADASIINSTMMPQHGEYDKHTHDQSGRVLYHRPWCVPNLLDGCLLMAGISDWHRASRHTQPTVIVACLEHIEAKGWHSGCFIELYTHAALPLVWV